MDRATKIRLVAEGRTRWFAIKVDVGRRFPTTLNCWARDEDHAREIITGQIANGQRPPCVIVEITEQHR